MAPTSAGTAALLHRERTGEGQMVEVPMLETLAAFNSIEMFGGMAFVPPIGPSGYKRMKARRPVRTKDGRLTMLPYSGACIEEFLVRDPVAHARNSDHIYDRMRDIAPSRTTAEWEELLLSIDAPHTGFARLSEGMEQPHLKAVGLFLELDHPSEGKILQARPPVRFSASPASIRCLPPRPREHTREVLREVCTAWTGILVNRPAFVPDAGDEVWLEFDPQVGHEPAGRRPAVAPSPAIYNGRTGLMVCCPLTTRIKGYPFEVALASQREVPSCPTRSRISTKLEWR
jgi:crotonobetainyl-CoA:carnitine CoA-transferase CaiB-like acyl-CoA transferase